jgi:hypothetical protein
MPNYENENSIFYFVREPSLRPSFNQTPDEYAEYLKFMEGSAKLVTLKNYCFEGVLILDGSFSIPVSYNSLISVKVGDKKLKTI